jgi:TPR repeat protein
MVNAAGWYLKSAKQGYNPARVNLGYCYYNGHGVVKDYVEAVSWWRKAAEEGVAEAQYSVGSAYRTGEGVEKDLAIAAKWLRLAAAQGHVDSITTLGRFHEFGLGVFPKDKVEAYAHYNLAGITSELAQKNRSEIEKEMNKEEIAAAQRRTRELQKEIESNIAEKKTGK